MSVPNDEVLSSNGPATPAFYPFRFVGRGTEYFQIWIVNLLLSVVTLGIYSAWAKVRSQRYLYANTSVAGDSFAYHATPIAILKGRMIAVGALAVYVLITEFLPILGLFVALGLLFCIPWMVVSALRFRAAMSSWRGIRFNFRGETGEAAGATIFWPMFGMLTLGLGFPYVWFKQAEFKVDNHRLGKTPISLTAEPVDFYRAALALALGALLVAGLVVAVVFLIADYVPYSPIDEAEMSTYELVVLVIMAAAYAAIYSIYSGLLFRVIYSGLRLGDNVVSCDLGIGRFLAVSLTNNIAIILTLGFFYPWAKIRMTSLLVNSLSIEATDLDGFVAAEADQQRALGEELGEAFDIGVSI